MNLKEKTVHTPALGLGTWAFGDDYWPGQDIKTSKRVIRKAVDLGITHIDTAPVYGNGTAEQLVGQVLRREMHRDRERFIITTKSFYYPREGLLKRVEKSLRRLQTEWIDIFYIHWPSPGKDMRPMMETLMELKKMGRVKSVGVSNFSVHELQKVMEAGEPEYYQAGYNLVWRKPEAEIIPFCRERGIKLVTYSSLAQGVLTGKFLSGKGSLPAVDVGGRGKTYFFEPSFRVQVEECLKGFCRLMRKIEIEREDKIVTPLPGLDAGATPGAPKGAETKTDLEQTAETVLNPGVSEKRFLIRLALNWLREVSGVTTVLVGARTPGQLEELMSLYNHPLPESIINAATEISDSLEYPDGESLFCRH